ncbi:MULTISPECIES: hypothetical protein [Streptomyces]|uniref:hypothetical protein n=1 Tax=Streptomyces lycopersici TaxID=2974589 RepID=UPI0021D238FC|nr:hypothetical protein [Streptomyces sp. NEAU-383]
MDRPVSASALASALATLQERHSLLGAAVDRAASAPEAVYRVSEGTIPLKTAADGTPWQAIVAVEQTRPIPPVPGTLARAVLVPQEPGCAIVLPSGDVPRRQEDLLAHVGAAADGDDAAADIQITNLGVACPNGQSPSRQSPNGQSPNGQSPNGQSPSRQSLSRRSPSGLSAPWGPAQTTQLRGEHILGVVTTGGRLRMTELTHDPVP